MTSPRTLHLFATSRLVTDGEVYRLVKCPVQQLPAAADQLKNGTANFGVCMVDAYEVTLVIAASEAGAIVNTLSETRQEGSFRLISFETVLEFDVIGFMAIVANVLAQANVSILPYAAFSRDHILVAEKDFDVAWQALSAAQENAARSQDTPTDS